MVVPARQRQLEQQRALGAAVGQGGGGPRRRRDRTASTAPPREIFRRCGFTATEQPSAIMLRRA